jgi:hypothetical protein
LERRSAHCEVCWDLSNNFVPSTRSINSILLANTLRKIECTAHARTHARIYTRAYTPTPRTPRRSGADHALSLYDSVRKAGAQCFGLDAASSPSSGLVCLPRLLHFAATALAHSPRRPSADSLPEAEEAPGASCTYQRRLDALHQSAHRLAVRAASGFLVDPPDAVLACTHEAQALLQRRDAAARAAQAEEEALVRGLQAQLRLVAPLLEFLRAAELQLEGARTLVEGLAAELGLCELLNKVGLRWLVHVSLSDRVVASLHVRAAELRPQTILC